MSEMKIDDHCKDCCCARSWKALGITEYTGKSIPEHIQEMEQRIKELTEALREINLHLRDVVETAANGDINNWNGYYLPLFKGLSEKYTAALKEGRA